MTSTDLLSVCETQFFPRKIDLRCAKTRQAYRAAINSFGKCLGRLALLSDLDDDAVTVWIGYQLDRCKSIYTVRERTGRLLCLWRWCASRRLVERFPTVRRPPAPEPVPVALSEEQLSALFAAAGRERGWIAGVRACDWWRCYLAFIWSTGERRGAALAMRWDWLDLAGNSITIPPAVRKGRRKAGRYPLWPAMLPLLAAIREPKRELVFPWDKCEGSYFYRFGRILRDAGLPDDRKHKTHCLRVSHATWLRVLGGDATRALMHSDPATTARHYIDVSKLPPEPQRLFVPWAG